MKRMIKLNHKLAGVFQILISSTWVFRNLSIIYDYRVYPYMLRLFWIPEWILAVQAIIGFLGIVVGILTFQKKLKIGSGSIIIGLAWLIGFGTELILLT